MGVGVSMRVLVTGADGFIGSHLVEGLLKWDLVHEVVALVHSLPVKWLPKVVGGKLQVLAGDIRRPHSIAKIGQVDIIFHLAAVSSVASCERRPESARLTNFQGTINLLNMALEMYPKPVFVNVSTAALYGEPLYLPRTTRSSPATNTPAASSAPR
jgi:dTDP-glucose 4,6-dehydratase